MNKKPNLPLKTILLLLLLVAVGGIFTLIAIQLTAREPLFDFTAFWIAGKLTLSGADPYLKSDWIPLYEPFNLGLADNQTFLYPKPILPLFIPFGLLSLRTAAVIWLVITQSAILGSILLLSRLWQKRSLDYLLPFIFGVLIFRSYIVTLTLGQLGGVILLLLTAVTLMWEEKKWFWGGLLFSLLALKPSLGFPLIGLASLWFLKKRIWPHFMGMAAGGALMLATGWLIDPDWISKFLAIGSTKVAETFGYHPTLWGMAGFLCGRNATCTYSAGGFVSVLILLLFFWLINQSRYSLTAGRVLSASIIFTLLLTPYLWVYDQILLIIPLANITQSRIENKLPYLTTALVPIFLGVLSLLLLPIATKIQADTWSVLVPFLLMSLYLSKNQWDSESRNIDE